MTSSQSGDSLDDVNDSAADAGTEPPHRWGFGAFLLVEAVLLASAAFVSVLVGQTPAGEPIPAPKVLIGTITPTVIAAGVAVIITLVRGNGPWTDLRLGWRWADVKAGLRFGLYGLVCTTFAAFLWTKAIGQDKPTSAISALVEDLPMSVTAAVTMFAYLWLIGPICEEIIYRGLLWGSIERMHWGQEKWGRLAAFAISTAVFAVSHFEPLRTLLLLVIAVPIGLARLYTGRLLSSIVAHQVNNFLPALMLLLTSLGAVRL